MGHNGRGHPSGGRSPLHQNERQRRSSQTKGDSTMTRHSYQQGYVSNPISRPYGVAFRIRYRVRTIDGKWKHKSELLYGLAGKKAARAILNDRLKTASIQKPEAEILT